MIRRPPPIARLMALAATLICAAAQAQTPGEAAVTKRATELRDTPSDAGRSLGALAAATPITRLDQRSGPWVQVRSGSGQAGWLHLFDVAPAGGTNAAQSASAGGSGVLRNVTGLFSRGAQPTTATSTIGIRGLGAEDIANAQPNVQAVAQIEAQRQTESQARDFARRAQLRSQSVEPLPAPRPGALQ